MEIIIGLFVGVIGSLIAAEFYDRLPGLSLRLISHATALLPKRESARYREEWLAHLSECPGNLGMIRLALEFYFASRKLRHQFDLEVAAEDAADFRRKMLANALIEEKIFDNRSGLISGAIVRDTLIGVFDCMASSADPMRRKLAVELVERQLPDNIRGLVTAAVFRETLKRLFYLMAPNSDFVQRAVADQMIEQKLPDNNRGQISAANVREVLSGLVEIQ